MNLDPLRPILSLILFLTFSATSILLLSIKISCSSSTIDERIQAFLGIKSFLAVYSWLIISSSWLLTAALFTRVVPRRLRMRSRKYFYIISNCSVIYGIIGGINSALLSLSEGRIIACEGSGWRDLLLAFSRETLSYFASFPNILVPTLSLLSLIWFSVILFKVHRVTLGLSTLESLRYSLAFTLTFVLLSAALMISASLITLSLLSP